LGEKQQHPEHGNARYVRFPRAVAAGAANEFIGCHSLQKPDLPRARLYEADFTAKQNGVILVSRRKLRVGFF
jgi:hypothetical protein